MRRDHARCSQRQNSAPMICVRRMPTSCMLSMKRQRLGAGQCDALWHHCDLLIYCDTRMEEILHHLGCSKTLKLMGQTTCTNSNLCSISAINSIWLVHRNGKTRTKPKVQLHGPPFFCVFRIFWIIVFCCKSFSGRAWLGRVMSCVSSNVTALLWAIVGRRNFRLLLLWDFLQARPLDTVVASDILIHPVIVRMQFQMCRISMFAARQLRENCTPVGCSDWAQRVCTHTHNERQMTCELFCAIRCD